MDNLHVKRSGRRIMKSKPDKFSIDKEYDKIDPPLFKTASKGTKVHLSYEDKLKVLKNNDIKLRNYNHKDNDFSITPNVHY